MASESGEMKDILFALKQIISECFQEIDVNTLTLFDLEYLFIKLRAKSVNNIVEVTYKDPDDNKNYDFAINLDEINVKFPENVNDTIIVNDQYTLKLKYANLKVVDSFIEKETDTERVYKILYNCLDKLYEGEKEYDFSQCSLEEVVAFVDSLDVNTFNFIQKFIDNQPKLYHELDYTDSNNKKKKIKLDKLKDFFTLG